MYKDSLDIRHKEFIGVVLPDPRKESNGMFSGMLGGLVGAAATAMTGGLAGVAMGALGTNTALGSLGMIGNLTGVVNGISAFNSIITPTNLIPTVVSMGMSSLSGGSFLNLGGALTGMIANTPQLAGLTNSFNTISGISNGFAGLSSTVMGLGNGVINGLGTLGNFAQGVNSTLPSGITNTLFNSIGLNVNDLSISNEIASNLGIGSNPINLVDIHNFNGMSSPMRGINGSQDISSVKGLGNQVATEPDGNIKVLVHVPELMYHIEEDKGIWCFNRLVTASKSSSATSSGMMGALSKGSSGFSGGSALGGGNVGSALSGMSSMGNVGQSVSGAMFGPSGSVIRNATIGGNTSSTVGTTIGTMIGGSVGGLVGGAVGGMLGGDDKGSGSDGAYGPLQPGVKVFIRFTENDFNTGNIVGIVHEEEDPATGGPGGNIGGNLLSSSSSGIGTLGSISNLGGFTNTISNFSSSLSGLTNTIGSVSGILNSANSFANSITNVSDVIGNVANHAFQAIPFVNSVTNTIKLVDNVVSSISNISDIVI